MEIWARLHVETGLSLAEFDELTIDEIEALNRALSERIDRGVRRDADYYALLCNLHGHGKRVWKAEDFLGKETASVQGPEAEAAIRAYYEANNSKIRSTRRREPTGTHLKPRMEQ